MSSKTWTAAYLYCAEETWSTFLTHAVPEFISHVQKKKLAKQFFFIRYWERGPHIRLRFKGDAKLAESKLRPYMEKYFKDYFEKNQSKRADPGWLSTLPIDQQWFPNDSIQFITYEPETDRYGGEKGILIAEKQFEASSKAVLSVMKEGKDWNYDRALGTAIQMHLGFAAGMRMSIKELQHFCSLIYSGWFPRSYPFDPKRSEEDTKRMQGLILKAFEDNYSKQKQMLIPYHRTIWNALQEGVEFEQDWFNLWVKEMKGIYKELTTAQKNNKLVFSQWFKTNKTINVPASSQKRWIILESYVHMTNNRLGIQNRDEAYLGYIIMNSVKEM